MRTQEHSFGGSWTKAKLKCLREYLHKYMTIMAKQPFTSYYVDAFAGTGYAVLKSKASREPDFFEEFGREDTQDYIKGSARLALETTPAFDRFLFIEKKGSHCAQLHQLRHEFPGKAPRVQIEQADANDFLTDWCRRFPSGARAVVFLDPYGMEVEWRLIEQIAQTKAIDLWFLFPLSGVVRMLPRAAEIPDSWRRRLDRVFGTRDWETEFFRPDAQPDMFSTGPAQQRDVTFDRVAQYVVGRLTKEFHSVAQNPYILRNDQRTPLYLLCFAAGNPQGGPIAVRIAGHLLGALRKTDETQ